VFALTRLPIAQILSTHLFSINFGLAFDLHFLAAYAVHRGEDTMRQARQSRLAAVAVAVVLAMAARPSDGQQPNQTPVQVRQTVKRVIVVSLEDHRLALLEDGKVKKIYTVAVGKPSTPSPTGTFTIESRVANPTYSHEGRVVPPGPQNPVGSRWMGLSMRGYGIHGTNAPSSIGKAASHGCIRMGKADVEELFAQVQVGDIVELVGTRNDETAQLFGTPATMPQGAQTTVTVASAAKPTAAEVGSL
jgi:lipoprotein-anchoring transpeptidase ErfK/SrfK